MGPRLPELPLSTVFTLADVARGPRLQVTSVRLTNSKLSLLLTMKVNFSTSLYLRDSWRERSDVGGASHTVSDYQEGGAKAKDSKRKERHGQRLGWFHRRRDGLEFGKSRGPV
jgi:hypothetical protein